MNIRNEILLLNDRWWRRSKIGRRKMKNINENIRRNRRKIEEVEKWYY